jgi:hypothetical protein
MLGRKSTRRHRREVAVAAMMTVLAMAGACTTSSPPTSAPASSHPASKAAPPHAPSDQASTPPAPEPASPTRRDLRKVLLIVEENHGYGQVVGAPDAPYLNSIAATYGSATNMDAGYPTSCPSLAAYILITSGSAAGICDDEGPQRHPLASASIFGQLDAAGLQWRTYAEHAPANCPLNNTSDGVFLVRHTPIAYYTGERARCQQDDVPLGTLRAGALRHDIDAGHLPSYAFVTPDGCDDMHGAPSCPDHLVAAGDAWLSQWLPAIMSGPDYRSGQLVVMITWDEGDSTGNHIPTVVVSPSTHRVQAAAPFTHCSTLRTAEDLLGLGPLGCAGNATSMASAFHLQR